MSLSFWLILTALVALALLFVVYPVLRRSQSGKGEPAPDRRSQNLAAYRSRLAELEQERETGVLAPEDYESLKEELEAGLLEDVEVAEQAEERPRAQGRLFWFTSLAAFVLVPVLSLAMYQHWGASDELARVQAMQEWRDKVAQGEIAVPALLKELRDKLEANPDNVEGWAMLGRFSMRIQDYGQAAYAYQRLADLVGENPMEAAAAWGLVAQARFFDEQGQLTDSVQSAIKKARDRNPNEVNSLGLLGIAAFQQQDFREAIKYWNQLLEAAPQHPQRQTIEQGIARARQALGLPPVADAGEEKAGGSGAAPKVQVELKVSLSESLGEQPAPGDTLFVYAKATSGPPMPLAIKRLTASDLPVTVTLTDKMAMSPRATLATADNVMLIARVSPSGNAMPQSGDWQGQVGPIEVTTDMGSHTIKIDQRLQ
ncbi:c-type cytochrome biogenesis protein CcmI [Marinobacteraceae bacterium S3BR75-40.1]